MERETSGAPLPKRNNREMHRWSREEASIDDKTDSEGFAGLVAVTDSMDIEAEPVASLGNSVSKNSAMIIR